MGEVSIKYLRDNIAENPQEFSLYLRAFLDDFRRAPSLAAISDEPSTLVGVIEDGAYRDAYLAAVAEYLAEEYNLPIPEWASASTRFIQNAEPRAKTEALKNFLIKDSPEAFKKRGVFVSENAMVRV